MSSPSQRPSLLWPIFAFLAWGLLLVQVFVQLPQQRDRLRELQVPLPALSQWALDHAVWAVPVLGIVSAVLAGFIPRPERRWLVFGLVPVVCLLLFLGLQWLALLQLMTEENPTGL